MQNMHIENEIYAYRKCMNFYKYLKNTNKKGEIINHILGQTKQKISKQFNKLLLYYCGYNKITLIL